MASLALHLKSSHHKPSQIILKSTSSNLTFSLLFSSSSSSSDNNNNNNGSGNPFSSYFDDIKSKLKHHEVQREHQQSSGFRYPTTELNTQGPTNPKNAKSFDEIRKNLSEFRRRSTVPPPGFEQQQQQSTLFQSRNAGNPNANLGGKGGELSFSAIRESLRKMRGTGGVDGSNTSDTMSLANYKKNLRLQQATPETGSGIGRGVGGLGVGIAGKVIGGSTENLPKSVFGKEMKEKEMKTGEARDGEDDESCFELFNMYTHDELGKKLKELRPEVKGKEGGKEENWFSISELGKRLKKLKEVEENQSSTVFSELRKSLSSLNGKDNKPKYAPIQSLGLLSPSNFTEHPPQEHLVEKYFHPDNMSAEEKLKLELKKVRDEFKMHESDCGSTRVQIAQLTTEILHLSSVLHKKDKHSRRGLQAKVQQRKKLLKYLRRTDWESYCFVLSKLGLRDNPDYKN